MRAFALLTIACASCAMFEPIDDVPNDHTVFPDTQSAIAAILATEHPRVFAIGEYHPSAKSANVRTPLSRFTDDVLPALKPITRELVVESWTDHCGTQSTAPQIAAALNRPPSQGSAIHQLAMESLKLSIHTHGLPVTCIEQQAMRDPKGGIDFFRLLQLVTSKLEDETETILADHQSVIVYGGALHNDLFPRWPLDGLSYAAPLEKKYGVGSVVEIDLVVPEVVAPMAQIRLEPWFPLLGLAAPNHVIVWRRGPHSFVVILPAESTEVAKIARPLPVM